MTRNFVHMLGSVCTWRWLGALLLATLAGCGGGSEQNSASPADEALPRGTETNTNTPAAPNVINIKIDGGISGRSVNVPFASLTVCTPGSTSSCSTIDHILVDTASTGLRIVSSALSRAGINAADYSTAMGEPLAECFGFVDGSVWGRLRRLDVGLGGYRLQALPVQIIGDEQAATLPADCTGPFQNTVESFGANGVLGVSTFLQDCGATCAVSAAASHYYRCPATGCVRTSVPSQDQLQNPISLIPDVSNGLAIALPDVPDNGATAATGALIMGINTRANNALPAASTIFPLDPRSGYLSVLYKGMTLSNSFFDTGSNFLFFNDASIPKCVAPGYSRFYCPAPGTVITTSLTAQDGRIRTLELPLADVYSRYTSNPANSAFRGLGASSSLPGSFDFGIPFFLGRTVFTAFEGVDTQSNVAGVFGPWVAF